MSKPYKYDRWHVKKSLISLTTGIEEYLFRTDERRSDVQLLNITRGSHQQRERLRPCFFFFARLATKERFRVDDELGGGDRTTRFLRLGPQNLNCRTHILHPPFQGILSYAFWLLISLKSATYRDFLVLMYWLWLIEERSRSYNINHRVEQSQVSNQPKIMLEFRRSVKLLRKFLRSIG